VRRALLALTLLAGCTDSPKAGPKAWSEMSGPERQRELDASIDKCGLPHSFFTMNGDEVHIRPKPDEDYKKVECGLAEAKRLNIAKLGFVGNEAYSDDLK